MKMIASIILCVFLSGCTSMFTSKTKASYTPGGPITYESDKEQVGLDVTYEVDEKGNVKKVRIKVDKSGTPEAAIAAALQQSSEALGLLKELLPLLKAGKVQ